MADRKGRYVIADVTGGRNGFDPPWAIGDTQCADAVNVEWYGSQLGRKRSGLSSLSLTFSAGGPFALKIYALYRHVPSTDETAAELWANDQATLGRLAGAATWTAPTLKDALTGNGYDTSWASVNGKLFIAVKTAVSRLHCWDTATVRRTGIDPGANAPTVANTGAGAYAATLRYYRVRFLEIVGGVAGRRSEATPSVSFTPSGAGTAARVTQPTVPNEGETHWAVEASTDNVTFYQIATPTIATTFSDDTAAPATYATTNQGISAATGTFTLQKSYKFICGADNRLLGFGSYTTTDKQNRIEWSGVVGSLNVGDAERVDTTIASYLDLDEHDTGAATGLVGPVDGEYYAFKQRQWWELHPTGDATRPFTKKAISKTLGALRHQAIAIGEDRDGNPAVYAMSHRGPYRYGRGGLVYIGRGIEDLWNGTTSTWDFTASVVAHTCYYPDKRQVWFWFATGSTTYPNQLAIYDVQTGGWSRVPLGDLLAGAICAVAFGTTVGATMGLTLKPYIGGTSGGSPKIWKCDTGTDDDGTTYRAYVVTKAVEPGGPGFKGSVGEAELWAKAASGVTITDTVTRDFGVETQTATALLTLTSDEGSATRVGRVLENSAFGDCRFVQHQLGDASAVSNAWTLDRLVTPFERAEATTR